MKKIFFITSFFLSVYTQSQVSSEEKIIKVEVVNDTSLEKLNFIGKNEIRLNAINLIVVPGLNVFYERVIDQYNGYGLSMFVNFSNPDNLLQRRFALNPYYRFYFLNKKDFGARGFFVEGFSSFASIQQEDINNSMENSFEISIGISIGSKLVNKRGFTFEWYTGVGRYLTNSELAVHVPFGLSIGKRF